MEFAIKTIGIDGAMGCINAFTTTTGNIYSLLKKLSTQPESQSVTQYMKETDLERKLTLLDCIVKNINVQHDTEALQMSIVSLKQCISEIDATLKEIDKRLQYNCSLWVMKSMRCYGFSDLYGQLKIYSQMLEDRKRSLIEVLQINVYLNGIKQPDAAQNLPQHLPCDVTAETH